MTSLAAELEAVARATIGACLFVAAAMTCLLAFVFGIVSVCWLLTDFMWAVWP